MKDNHRGKILYQTLKKHLKKDDTILDFCCGESPMAQYLIQNNNKIIGFDNDKKNIMELKHTYPEGQWDINCFSKINYSNVDVLLFLGYINRSDILESIKKFLKKNKVRIILTETNLAYRNINGNGVWIKKETLGIGKGFLSFNIFLLNNNYVLLDKKKFNKTINSDSIRFCEIWKYN